MSEYWVSKKKYRCQYCEIYIADDAPSRSQHENGLRHKGNKDRFIRSLYKSRVKQKNDSEEEKREMKRVEQAAQAAYALDIGAGHVAASSSSSAAAASASAPKPKPPPPKPLDPYANYTTAASLGISDPDVDRLIEEAKVRQSEGRAGDWVAVMPPPPPLPEASPLVEGVKVEQEVAAGEVRKREENPPDEDDTRRFKVRRKTAAVGLGEIYDPGVIRVKARVQRDAEGESTVKIVATPPRLPAASGPVLGGDVAEASTRSEVHDTLPKATEKPSWTRREWKWAGEDQLEGAVPSTAPLRADDAPVDEKPKFDATAEVLERDVEREAAPVAPSSRDVDGEVLKKEEPTDPDPLPMDSSSNGSLFRKRKVPAGSNRGRRKV